MSVTLAHPFRLDAAGAVVTVAQNTQAHALEVVRHIVSCRVGERGLSPDWGLADPLANGVDEEDIRAAVDLCDPDIELLDVRITTSDADRVDIAIDARWRESGE